MPSTNSLSSSPLNSNALPGAMQISTATNLSAFLAMQGWQDLTSSIYTTEQHAQEKSQQLEQAIARYTTQPDEQNTQMLLQHFLDAQTVLERELKEAKEQRDLYQTQVQERAQQATDYSLSAGLQWALHGVKDFFGSSPEALAEKYAGVAAEREAKLVQLQAGIRWLEQTLASENIVAADPSLFSEGSLQNARHLLQHTEEMTGLVSQLIPDQVIDINRPYRYSLNDVFSGNYTLLSATETGRPSLPSWLSLQYAHLGNYSLAGGEAAYDVAVSGSMAYVAYFTAGLHIVDVSNPSTPALLGTYRAVSGYALDVAVSGSMAYVAYDTAGLHIVDVSNPRVPALLGTYYVESELALDVAVSGSTAYLAYWTAGLHIVDVSNPRAPTLLGTYRAASGEARGVAVSGSIAYVAYDTAGLHIVDVSNPSTPALLGTYSATSWYAWGVAVSGSTVYLAYLDAGLHIVNVSNSSTPALLGTYSTTSGDLSSVAVSGNTVYLGCWNRNEDVLHIVDVRNPSTPALLGTYSVPGNEAYSVAISGGMISLAGTGGLHIVDVSQGELRGVPVGNRGQKLAITVSARNATTVLMDATFTLTLDNLPYLLQTTVSDQRVFPDKTLSLDINPSVFINPSQLPLAPSLQLTAGGELPPWLAVTIFIVPLATYSVSSGSADGSIVVLSGSTAYLTHSTGLDIVDVSNPGVPVLLGTYDAWVATGIAISGSMAYLAYGSQLHIVDVSDPSAPSLLYTYKPEGCPPSGVAVSGNIAYVTCWSAGLHILNVSNSSAPVLLGIYRDGGAFDVDVWGSTAYVMNLIAGLRIVNVSNPRAPELLGTYDYGEQLTNFAISGSLVYLTYGSTTGLHIVDVSDPRAPVLLGTYSGGVPGSKIYGVAVSGSLVYLTYGSTTGLHIVDVSDPRAPVLLGTYSNSVPGSEAYSFDVAILGNVVYTVYIAYQSAWLQIVDVGQWQLTAKPLMADVGNYALRLVGTNELGGAASAGFSLRVEGAPQIDDRIPLQYAPVGQTFNYFVPQGTFIDPNNDPIGFTAWQTNGRDLPPWLRFNGVSATFTGNPKISDRGTLNITIGATDYIAGMTNTTFLLFVGSPIPPLQPIHPGRPFKFSVPNSTFAVEGEVIREYNSLQSDGEPLPSWLTFDPETLQFSGEPPLNTSVNVDLGVSVIAITYQNDTIEASMSFPMTANAPFQITPIAVQTATVGTLFNLIVSPNTFVNPNGYPLTFSAMQADRQPLPAWLNFNAIATPPSFLGTPGYSDTDLYSARALQIALAASDGLVNGSTTFTLNVGGLSWGALAIEIGAPLLSAAGTAFTLYKMRALALNRCCKKGCQSRCCSKEGYQKGTQHYGIGESFALALNTPKELIRGVAVKLPVPVSETRGCRLFKVPRVLQLPSSLPGGGNLPYWLEYDPHDNELFTKEPLPESLSGERLVIQVWGDDGVILEQFDLAISSRRAVDTPQVAVEVGDGADIRQRARAGKRTHHLGASSTWLPLPADSSVHHSARKPVPKAGQQSDGLSRPLVNFAA